MRVAHVYIGLGHLEVKILDRETHNAQIHHLPNIYFRVCAEMNTFFLELVECCVFLLKFAGNIFVLLTKQ